MKRCIAMLLCVLLILLAGCGAQQADAEAQGSETSQRVQLVLTPTEEEIPGQGSTYFKAEELNGNYPGSLVYSYELSQVDILLSDTSMPLDQAIREGLITGEELTAMAFADARDGLCTQSAHSINGLTKFIFRYPGQFDLSVICDVYETPDGKQHLMNEIRVDPYLSADDSQGYYMEMDEDGSLTYIDAEDWGLTLECLSVSPTGMTLKITQADGQHAGQLSIDYYMIYDRDTSTDLTTSEGYVGAAAGISPAAAIANNGTTEITFDWTETFGTLESGSYSLILVIADLYDTSDVHPLQRNYHDSQTYSVAFTIP